MLRRLDFLVICLAVAISGCEKKQPQGQGAVATARQPSAAPGGMVAIGESGRVFVSQKPLMAQQYVAYLEGVGKSVPDQWKRARPTADQAITGLSRNDAANCATWYMRRLPTAEEWKLAAPAVGERPYPWTADGAPASASAEAFLVQDWLPNSDGEGQAREAKDALAKTVLDEQTAEVQQLRKQLEDLVGPQGSRRPEVWNQVKPAFFALLDREKKLAELIAERETRAEVLEILNQLDLEKARVAARLKAGEPNQPAAEEAVNAYAKKLTKARTDMQRVRDDLQNSTRAMQDEVVSLTKALEAASTGEAAGRAQQAQAVLAESSAPIQNAQQGGAVAEKLRAALQGLKESNSTLNLPSMEQIKSRTADLDKQTGELSGPDPAAEKISAVRQKMAELGGIIDHDFVQEKLLFQDLEDLVTLRAHKKAVQTSLDALKKALGKAPGARGHAQ